MKNLLKKLIPSTDIFLVPLVFLSACILKVVRKAGIHRLPLCKHTLLGVGVFPVSNHYYEPQFDFRKIKHSFSDERSLPAIDWNIQEQLQTLRAFIHTGELEHIPAEKPITGGLNYYWNNGSFESGDAEYWYQLIRTKRPNKIIEVGSGNSTLMAINAIRRNREDDPDYRCKHVCIEPYEMPWLEKSGVTVVRKKVEDIDISFFSELESGDILFIDSSHMIRPEGDVLFEYLQLLPSLKAGVIVHVHDIFSPRNYPDEWLRDKVRFWNEQYLLEAFLSHNASWKIVGSLNYLHHNHYDALKNACPNLTPDREPGSFYIQRIG